MIFLKLYSIIIIITRINFIAIFRDCPQSNAFSHIEGLEYLSTEN